MLFFWDFQHEPSKSEIILDKNLCLINILFKGRSASFQDKMDTEVGCEIFWIFFLNIHDRSPWIMAHDGGWNLIKWQDDVWWDHLRDAFNQIQKNTIARWTDPELCHSGPVCYRYKNGKGRRPMKSRIIEMQGRMKMRTSFWGQTKSTGRSIWRLELFVWLRLFGRP